VFEQIMIEFSYH